MKIANRVNTLIIFAKKAPPQMFDWIPNALQVGRSINVGFK